MRLLEHSTSENTNDDDVLLERVLANFMQVAYLAGLDNKRAKQSLESSLMKYDANRESQQVSGGLSSTMITEIFSLAQLGDRIAKAAESQVNPWPLLAGGFAQAREVAAVVVEPVLLLKKRGALRVYRGQFPTIAHNILNFLWEYSDYTPEEKKRHAFAVDIARCADRVNFPPEQNSISFVFFDDKRADRMADAKLRIQKFYQENGMGSPMIKTRSLKLRNGPGGGFKNVGYKLSIENVPKSVFDALAPLKKCLERLTSTQSPLVLMGRSVKTIKLSLLSKRRDPLAGRIELGSEEKASLHGTIGEIRAELNDRQSTHVLNARQILERQRGPG